MPPAPGPDSYLADLDPDVVLITPLIELGSTQADWLRAAKRRGVRTGFPVFSWDNLTNKGLLRDVPDLVLVWNDLQAAEARELHGVPAGRITLTGAPAFDHWFDWASLPDPGGVLCGGRSAPRPPDHPLRLLIGLHRPGRAGLRPRLDRAAPRARRRPRRRRSPRPPSSAVRDAVGGGEARWTPGRALAAPRRGSLRRGRAAQLLRLDLPRGRRRRDQHHRTDRGGDRRPSGAHAALGRVPRDAAGHAALPLPPGGGLRAAVRRGDVREPTRGSSRSRCSGRPDDGRNERFLRRFVRPLGLDVAACRGGRECGRGARGETGAGACPAAGCRAARPGGAAPSGDGRSRPGAQSARGSSRKGVACPQPPAARAQARAHGGRRSDRRRPVAGGRARGASLLGSRSCGGRRPRRIGLRERLHVLRPEEPRGLVRGDRRRAGGDRGRSSDSTAPSTEAGRRGRSTRPAASSPVRTLTGESSAGCWSSRRSPPRRCPTSSSCRRAFVAVRLDDAERASRLIAALARRAAGRSPRAIRRRGGAGRARPRGGVRRRVRRRGLPRCAARRSRSRRACKARWTETSCGWRPPSWRRRPSDVSSWSRPTPPRRRSPAGSSASLRPTARSLASTS